MQKKIQEYESAKFLFDEYLRSKELVQLGIVAGYCESTDLTRCEMNGNLPLFSKLVVTIKVGHKELTPQKILAVLMATGWFVIILSR